MYIQVVSDEFLHHLLDYGLSTTTVPSISMTYIFTLTCESVAHIACLATSDRARIFRIDFGYPFSSRVLNRASTGQEQVREKRKLTVSQRKELA